MKHATKSAVAAVTSGCLSAQSAAKQYKIPRLAIRDRIYQRYENSAGTPYLRHQQIQEKLANVIRRYCRVWNITEAEFVLKRAKKYVDSVNPPRNDTFQWLEAFYHRFNLKASINNK